MYAVHSRNKVLLETSKWTVPYWTLAAARAAAGEGSSGQSQIRCSSKQGWQKAREAAVAQVAAVVQAAAVQAAAAVQVVRPVKRISKLSSHLLCKNTIHPVNGL